MLKQGLVKHARVLVGVILCIPLVLLGLYSISSVESRFEPGSSSQNQLVAGEPDASFAVNAGAGLSVDMVAQANWFPTGENRVQAGVGGAGQASLAAQQASQSWLDRTVCIANTGRRETRGLTIQDRLEVEGAAGVFEPLPDVQADYPVERELYPHERWCHVQRYSLALTPGARYRLTTTVSITNYAKLLPGSSECPSIEGCPYGTVVSAILQIPLEEALVWTSTPTTAPALQLTSTPTQAVIVAAVKPSPADPDNEDPPASQPPQDTPLPQPPSNPDPTEEPDPSGTPDDEDENDGRDDDEDDRDDDDDGDDDDDDRRDDDGDDDDDDDD